MTAANRFAVSTHPAAVVLTPSWVPMVPTMGTTIVCRTARVMTMKQSPGSSVRRVDMEELPRYL
ncbi:unannotated protein [freshwater metagenome]|uniref:Unannotated protein n=1 Tax=freshwater metagenome TaxID=449393 RepID=A0A6J7H7V2_9ZZZZ